MEWSVIDHIMTVSPDDDTSSHILAIFHLSSVQGWVYIAMLDEEGSNVEDDVRTLVDGALAVEREDTSLLWDNTEGKALDVGIGEPWVFPVAGEEFLQTLVCLSQPIPSYHLPDDSSVGEWVVPHSFSLEQWVCVSRPGTYFGDVGCIVKLHDIPAPYIASVVLLMSPRTATAAENDYYESRFIRAPLRENVEPHDSRKPALCTTADGEEWWMNGTEKFSKEGLVYRTFSPWELRGDMLDGQELEVRREQALHFLASNLSPEAKKSMPRVVPLYSSINLGEVVSVGSVTDGVAAGYGVGVADGEAAILQAIYSSSTREGVYVNSHPSLMLKRHEVGQQAFSWQFKENVEIVSCDYFSQRVQARLQPTPARRKRNPSLVGLSLHGRVNS
jgi:hypothetical protein